MPLGVSINSRIVCGGIGVVADHEACIADADEARRRHGVRTADRDGGAIRDDKAVVVVASRRNRCRRLPPEELMPETDVAADPVDDADRWNRHC